MDELRKRCIMSWISAERGGCCSWSVAKKTGSMYSSRRWSIWTSIALTNIAASDWQIPSAKLLTKFYSQPCLVMNCRKTSPLNFRRHYYSITHAKNSQQPAHSTAQQCFIVTHLHLWYSPGINFPCFTSPRLYRFSQSPSFVSRSKSPV